MNKFKRKRTKINATILVAMYITSRYFQSERGNSKKKKKRGKGVAEIVILIILDIILFDFFFFF
jgi:uncharacterized membrane-anchored protein